jgi:DNA replication and repair protein RecF
MRLTQLALSGFRNLQLSRVEPGKRFNLLYGCNGQGKTNLLEAIYLLGSPRSFRHSRLTEYIRHGEKKAQIQGEVESSGSLSRIRLTLENAGRRVELDGKGIQRASDIHGKLSSVVFSPDDTMMIKVGPDARRRYLDRAVYTGDIGYLHCWHAYHSILKQRNQLLKGSDRSCLDIWTEKLAETGAEVIERRRLFVVQLDEKLKRHYGTISGDSETAGICYNPEGVRGGSVKDIRAELIELFNRMAKNDERYGTTTAGPHRDDLTFTLDGRPLKAFGSQGQQKSFVLALKMAEMDNLQAVFQESPLLLLDDMSSELDEHRNENLMEFLLSRDIQVFITSTGPLPALARAVKHCAVFRVEDGNLTFEGHTSHE